MKFKTLLVALWIAALSASAALASGPAQQDVSAKGKGRTVCGSSVSYVLNGSFVAAGTDSFTLTVKHSNKHGVKAGKTATVYVDSATRVARDDKAAKLTDLQKDDRVNVQARACKKADAATLKLVAKRVVAHSPAATEDDDDASETPAPAPTPVAAG